jgi:hypothetical protein
MTADVEFRGLAKAQFRKRPLRTPAKGLAQFRRVDFGQAHADLALFDQNGERITVVNRYHPGSRTGMAGKGREKKRE